MKKNTVCTQPSKREALKKMINKEVKVIDDGEWVGIVVGIVDDENLLVLKDGRETSVNIFDVRSK
jgi:hypothetical protein